MNQIFDIAADLDTPVSAFLKLEPLRPRFLLESVEHGERVGRYSFIGFGDGLEVVCRNGQVDFGHGSVETDGSMAEIMSALRNVLDMAPRPLPQDSGIPFHGGLVGAVGFDFAYRTPGAGGGKDDSLDMAFYAPASVLAFDHLSRRAALLHSGAESERLELRLEIIRLLSSALPDRRQAVGNPSPEVASIARPDFIRAVESAKTHIAAGDVYQLVVSVGFEGEADVDPFDVYRGLRLLNPSPYMYFIDVAGSKIIGSSPEALVRLTGQEAELRPIAGTRERSDDVAEDRAAEHELLADSKEAAEHVMLVDLARNDLGRVAVPGTIVVEPFRAIERYSHVMHLVSGVRGQVEDGLDCFDVFASAFPAGTVVGAPKVRALQLLEKLEPSRRGFYAGTVGYFGHGGSMDQAITIRTIVMEGSKYRFQAGAGIVADSDPGREWDEVMSKSDVMRSAIEMAAGGLS